MRVAVLDNDHGMTSRRLIERSKDSGYFQLIALPKSHQERHYRGWKARRPTSY